LFFILMCTRCARGLAPTARTSAFHMLEERRLEAEQRQYDTS
jgi:hypothetical protein